MVRVAFSDSFDYKEVAHTIHGWEEENRLNDLLKAEEDHRRKMNMPLSYPTQMEASAIANTYHAYVHGTACEYPFDVPKLLNSVLHRTMRTFSTLPAPMVNNRRPGQLYAYATLYAQAFTERVPNFLLAASGQPDIVRQHIARCMEVTLGAKKAMLMAELIYTVNIINKRAKIMFGIFDGIVKKLRGEGKFKNPPGKSWEMLAIQEYGSAKYWKSVEDNDKWLAKEKELLKELNRVDESLLRNAEDELLALVFSIGVD